MASGWLWTARSARTGRPETPPSVRRSPTISRAALSILQGQREQDIGCPKQAAYMEGYVTGVQREGRTGLTCQSSSACPSESAAAARRGPR